MKSVLLVELSTSHTEIIEPFVRALKGCQVEIVIPELGFSKISDKNLFHKAHLIKEKTGPSQAAHIIKKNHYDLIVYNSAQGKNVRNLVLKTFFNKTPVVGFHHNPISLVESFTQRFINTKVKKYILLADFNKEYVVTHGFPSEKVGVFYPIASAQPVNFEKNKIIAIPGVLEQDRRDYFGLIDMVKENPKSFEGYVFSLLGNCQTHDGPSIKAKIHSAGLEKFFNLFDGYVPDATLDEQLKKSKFIMPLMHPENRYFEVYLKTKISGAYNLAYAYQLPLLMHEAFATVSEFQKNCVFYEHGSLAKKIHSAVTIDHMYYEKFNANVQSAKLMQFLFS